MPGISVVKVRRAKDNRFVSIPKKFADEISARYLLVSMDNGRLVYEPVEETK
jgi:hypothetical protein